MDVPVGFLDNDFEDPDLDRYRENFERYSPSVAVVGDVYTSREAELYNKFVDDLAEDHPHKNFVIVPKYQAGFEEITENAVLGYPLGYSDLDPGDYSETGDWRGEEVHILGGNPHEQFDVVQDLTQPTLTGEEPADIVGADTNFFQGVAYVGEYWSRSGYQRADHLTVRETVRKSLEEIKKFWQEKCLWPETGPVELHGKPCKQPCEMVYTVDGGKPVDSWEELEELEVRRFDGERYGFETEAAANHFAYRNQF